MKSNLLVNIPKLNLIELKNHFIFIQGGSFLEGIILVAHLSQEKKGNYFKQSIHFKVLTRFPYTTIDWILKNNFIEIIIIH